MTGGREAEIAAVLAQHRLMFWTIEHVWGMVPGGSRTAPRCSCGVLRSGGGIDETLDHQVAWWEAHVAAVLAAQPETHTDREIAAAALREAADTWTQGEWADHLVTASDPAQIRIGSANRFGQWLRERADRIDNEGRTP